MARIRITLEDDDGREINGDKERLYDLSGGTKRFVDIEAAVEALKQAALPELTAELLTLAQHQCVAEVKKGRLAMSWDAVRDHQDPARGLDMRGPAVPVPHAWGDDLSGVDRATLRGFHECALSGVQRLRQ